MSIISSTMLIDIDEHARHDRRKLLAGSEVEVLQLEGELIGSWQKAIVINHSDLTRTVKYTNKPNSIQSVPVSYAIDGYLLNYPSQYSPLQKHPSSQISLRNNIRPVPYRQPVRQSEAIFGTCVDVFIKNAYFEGVIIDKQMVLLPDLGELENVTLNNLSFSLDFDEVTGEFKLRKKWMFLEALKEILKNADLSVSVRHIWYEAKSNPNFLTKIGVWYLGTRTDWDFLISNIMKNFEPVQANEFLDVVSDFVYAHQSKTGTRIREKQEAAQSYLISIGWQFNKTKGGNKYCVSNTGTRYRSFIAACEGYLSNQLSLTKKNDICDMNKNDICDGSGTQKVAWKPVTLDPEYCCEIEEDGFSELDKDKIRKHLLYLGWVVEIKREKRLRYRYRSPKGNWYYSLRVIHDGLMCGSPLERESQNQAQVTNFEPKLERERQNLEFNLDDFDFGENFEPKLEQDSQGEEANLGQNGEEFDLGENSLIEDIEPERLPNSIQEYIDFAENGLKRGIISPSDLRLNAKKHLLFNGWTRCTKSRSNRKPRMFYESPGGKLFCSLLRACKAFLQARFGSGSSVPVRVKKETKEREKSLERDKVDEDKLLEHFKRKLDDLVQNNSPLEINENLKRRKRRNEVGVTKKKEKERRRMGF